MNSSPSAAEVSASLRPWSELLGSLDGAAKEATPGGGTSTPMWDRLAREFDQALQKPGARARIARHLGLPRQRITDYTKGRRTPDAETTLRILHWLVAIRTGPDPSLPADSAAPAAAVTPGKPA